MRKKLYFVGVAIIIAFAGLMLSDSNAQYVCGDANDDGALNVSDAVYIINYVFIGGPALDPDCCEWNCPPIVTDYDGNYYFTAMLGNQCWMLQDLRVTHYRNGDPIPKVTDVDEWLDLSTGAYCEYNNDPAIASIYGLLYNWYAVDDSRSIAPEGWHVATDAEYKQLEMYLGMSAAEANSTGQRGTDEGGKLKEAGITHWLSPNIGANNESGFSALPGGYRGMMFRVLDSNAIYWSSSEYNSSYAWSRTLYYDLAKTGRQGSGKGLGLTVRCVKD